MGTVFYAEEYNDRPIVYDSYSSDWDFYFFLGIVKEIQPLGNFIPGELKGQIQMYFPFY